MVLILTVVLAPLVIYCDTDKRKCYFKLIGILSVTLADVEGSPHFIFSTLGYSKKVNIITVLKERKVKREVHREKKVEKSSGKKSFGAIVRFIKESLKTFRVKRFILDIDFDDYVLNGQLYPLFYWLSTKRCTLSTNYNQHNYLHLRIENRLIRIVPPVWRLMISK